MEEFEMPFSFAKQLKKTQWMFCFFLLSVSCFAASNNNDLVKKINSIEKRSNVIMGITAIHIEKNKTITHNGTKRFFMASTFKLPIAMAFLNRVDHKQDSLNRIVKLDCHNSVPGSGTLYHLFERKNISMSMQQLLRHMLINSDNSASDTILKAGLDE